MLEAAFADVLPRLSACSTAAGIRNEVLSYGNAERTPARHYGRSLVGAPDDNPSTERLAAPNVERRLAAVAFADVAGFSALVGRDDVQTTIRWKSLRRDFLEPKIAEYCGRLVREKGDELFVEFSSAVAAIRWAHDVQRGIAESQDSADHSPPLQLRIGINVEDVIVDGDELHGDGVNIAARIQQLGKPGDTLLTGAVYEYVWNKVASTRSIWASTN